MFLTYLMHYCLLNIEASKQTTIFDIAMAPKLSNTQLHPVMRSTNIFQNFIGSKFKHSMFLFSLRHTKFCLFANQFDQWFHKIHDNKILTFVNVISDLGEEHNNDSQQSAPVASFDNNALPFTPIPWEGKCFESMPQSTTANVIQDMESLSEPDDKGLAIVKDPRVELLCWHYQLKHLGFRVLQTLAKLRVLPKRLSTWCLPNVLHAFMVLLISNHGKHELKQAMFIFFLSHHQPNAFPSNTWFLRNQVLLHNWRDGWQLQDIGLSWCSWIIFLASGTYT